MNGGKATVERERVPIEDVLSLKPSAHIFWALSLTEGISSSFTKGFLRVGPDPVRDYLRLRLYTHTLSL